MKKTLLATALALASMSSFAADYFLVVPVPGKTSSVAGINVTLASYSLPSAIVGTPYAGFDLKPMLSVSGDPAYTGYGVKWSLASGSLPAGLTLNANGTISGTPTAAGTGSFQVKATYKTKSGTQAYQILVGEITVALAAATPPKAIVGQAYSFDLKSLLTVSGDSAYQAGTGVTWSVVADTLPAGLQLRTDGTIAGTPTGAGNGSVTARATYKARNGDQTYQVVSLDIKVALATATLPPAKVGTAYAAYDFKNQLTVSGDPDYAAGSTQFSATGVPTGLSVSPSGVLSGTPTTKSAGSQFNVVASYKNITGQQVYTIVINGQVLLAKQVSAGVTHSCAVTASADVMCWGDNSSGQLGDGTSNDTSNPVQVVGLTGGVASVAVGAYHSCAVTTAGAALCWGWNGEGELGDGTTTQRLTPVSVSGLSSGVTALSSLNMHTCAVVNGAAKCWGYNRDGAVGDGTYDNRLVPVMPAGLSSGVTAVAAGQMHSCAVLSTGGVKCWGANGDGELGDGTGKEQLSPVSVSGLTGARSIAAGGYHTCVTTSISGSNGRACWGANPYGQLGDGSRNTQFTPVSMADGTLRITAGDMHTCVVTSSGAARCFGSNYQGQLGNGTRTDNPSANTDVSGLSSGVQSISAGQNHTCAVLTSGDTKCWGNNNRGQLGDGTQTSTQVPVNVTN